MDSLVRAEVIKLFCILQFINNYIRANVIFETLDTLLAETKADFLTIAFLKDLNGRFIKDTYKGVSVSDVQVA